MTPSLEGWPTKAKEAPSPHEVRLAPLDTNPVFQCLRLSMSICFGYTLDSHKKFPENFLPQKETSNSKLRASK